MRPGIDGGEELIDAVAAAVAVVDPDTGTILDANDAFCDLYGRERSALLGRSLEDIVAEEWTPSVPVDDRLEDARNGADPDVEWRCRCWDEAGSQWVDATLSAFEDGEDTCVAMTVTDAGTGRPGDPPGGAEGEPPVEGDDRESADRDTPLTEEELRAVYHSVNDAIYVHDADGDLLDVNRTAAETYGYSREAFRRGEAGETSSGDPPYTRENARDRLERAAAGEPQTFEWQGKDSDGNVFWEEVSLTRTVVDGEVRVLGIVRNIDERKAYESELEYRKALLEAQTEASIDGHLVVGREGRVVSYNSKFLEMWDLDEAVLEAGDERIVEAATDAVEDPEDVREWVEHLYDNPREEFRREIRMADGRWLDWFSAPVVGEDDTLYGRLSVFRDVTERKQRERELEARNDRLRALFANSTAAIVEYAYEDGEPVVEDVNDRFEEIFGYDAGTVVGHSLDEFIVPPESAEEADDLNATVERGEYLSTEVERETADGTRSFLLRNAPIDTDEETRGYASYTDITERKEREREIEEQREKYSTLVEQSHEGVVIVQDEEFKFVNQAMADLVGRSRDDLVGSPFYEIMPPEYRELVRERYEQRVRGEDPPQRYDVEVLTSDGERRDIDLEVSAIQYQGEPATMATFNDITERKQFERTLEDKNKKLELLNRIVRHDIRNDMSVARAEASILEDHLDEAGRPHLDALVESVDHVVELTDIVRDLMETMLEERDATEPIPLGRTLADELDVVRAMEGVDVEAPTPPPEVTVEADEMLGTVFRNLLTNAVRHNDTDRPQVTVSVDEGDGEVVVRVADDGPGVRDDMKEEVFGRGEKGLESPGSGVGLYLVDTLVEGYGGEVWVEDNDPRGAVFAVRLRRTDPGGED